jgi:hypothetical protein
LLVVGDAPASSTKILKGSEEAFEVEEISKEDGLAEGDQDIAKTAMSKGILQDIVRFHEDHGVHIVEIIPTPPNIFLILLSSGKTIQLKEGPI